MKPPRVMTKRRWWWWRWVRGMTLCKRDPQVGDVVVRIHLTDGTQCFCSPFNVGVVVERIQTVGLDRPLCRVRFRGGDHLPFSAYELRVVRKYR